MVRASGRRDVPNKVFLSEREIPSAWYNMTADLPGNIPAPLNPQTKKALSPGDLAAIFPNALIEQEVSAAPYIDIPDDVRRLYATYRPAPLIRAYRLEDHLGTPARIYYKYEGGNTSGSHKLNTALPQAYFNKDAGIRRLSTETGAGQWGTALAMASTMFGLECTVYMVRVSYEQKPHRRGVMEAYGAQVIASPSALTQAGRKQREFDPAMPGSLGIAISEAVEDAAQHDDTNYALGSVLNHVLIHQSVIGLEAQAQMAAIDEYPDTVIGCVGGGSNFGGIAGPFVRDIIRSGRAPKLIGVEPTACPTLTRGRFAYDYGDTAGLTPMMAQYTLGHDFMPPSIHSGGLRYHGASALVSHMLRKKLMEARAVPQASVFEAGVLFARVEGLLPAPESMHAIRVAIDEALKCKESGEEKVILFCLSGHGHFDLTAYDNYLSGKVTDFVLADQEIRRGFDNLPQVDEAL